MISRNIKNQILAGSKMGSDGQIVALIGGGRWGRTHASNLFRLLTSGDRVVWVSRHNQSILRTTIAQFSPGGPQFDVLSSLEDCFRERPSAALVITSSMSHFSIAQACLREGMHTFVEKPLCLRTAEAISLIDIAVRGKLVLAVGLHLLSASYIQHFKKQLPRRAISHIAIRWFDPDHEQRYGEIKRPDYSTPIVHDIYPHIWSLVRAITDCTEQSIHKVSVEGNGALSIISRAGGVVVKAECQRGAKMRDRSIQITFWDGSLATFDFTREPGISTLNGTPLQPDPSWSSGLTPLMAEIKEFLNQISLPARNMKWAPLAEMCLNSVTDAEIMNDQLEELTAGSRPGMK
jgi:predicted dehydrogenase